MSRSFKERWTDFSGRYGTTSCCFCKHQSLNFSEPKRDNIAGADVVAITCSECGHIELFDMTTVESVADEIDQDYRDKGWR